MDFVVLLGLGDGNVFSMLPEYSTTGLAGPGTGSTLAYDQTYGGSFTIAPSSCPGSSACTVDDTAIASELASQVGGALAIIEGAAVEVIRT